MFGAANLRASWDLSETAVTRFRPVTKRSGNSGRAAGTAALAPEDPRLTFEQNVARKLRRIWRT